MVWLVFAVKIFDNERREIITSLLSNITARSRSSAYSEGRESQSGSIAPDGHGDEIFRKKGQA